MKVYLRISCAGFVIDKTKTEIEAPDDATVFEVLQICAAQHNADILIERLGEFVLLVNSSPSKLNRRLSDGDKINLIRIMSGG